MLLDVPKSRASVNDDLDGIDIGPEPILAPKSGRRNGYGLAIGLVFFAFLASGMAYVWLNYGNRVRAAVLWASPEETPVVARGEDALSHSDFETYRQQSIELLRSTNVGLDAQKEEFKRIFDRLSALESKVDAMQLATSTTAIAPAAPPAHIATVASPPTVTPRPPPAVQRPRPAAPKPPGRVSVGGAPLPGAPN
jgi:hypothetical protein